MPLDPHQVGMGAVLLQPVGLNALSSDETWQGYTKTSEGSLVANLPRERLALYQELLFNTVEDTMSSFYPHCRRFIGDDWDALVERYRRDHPSVSYLLYKVAQHFPAFLSRQSDLLNRFPFLPDLALYQWLDIEVYNAPDVVLPGAFFSELVWTEDLFERGRPYWNPVHRLVEFSYSVPDIIRAINEYDQTHDEDLPIPEGVIPVEKQPTRMFIYRDPESLDVRFFQLNELTSALIQTSQTTHSYIDLFETLSKSLPALAQVPLETVVMEGAKLLQHCHQQGMLLGSVIQAE